MRVIMKSLTGWQIVALVGLFLGALVVLVAMGQEIGAIVAGIVAILAVLGFNSAQNAVNLERTGEVRSLANGTNEALRTQITTERDKHAEERAALLHQIQATNEKLAATAALVSPEQAAELKRVINNE